MRIIDTHTHIYIDKFENDIEEVIMRAKNVGVKKILLPNVDLSSIEELHALSSKYPDYCFPMMGLHPTSVDENWEINLSQIRSYLASSPERYIGVGEIGIDLYWDKTFVKEQCLAFEQQLEWSVEYHLPVSIHTREATQIAIDCIKNIGGHKLNGVFHSFVGSSKELEEILVLDNFFIGINGVVTYKNSDLRNVLRAADLSKIVIETDAPYLPPVPYRGKRNEPSYTSYIVNELATIYNVSPEEVGEITFQNAIRLFKLTDQLSF